MVKNELGKKFEPLGIYLRQELKLQIVLFAL